MSPTPSVARRHRWYLAGVFGLMATAVLVFWVSPFALASLIGFTILSIAALVWFLRGQSWVLRAAPPGDAAVAADARRFGRRVMLFSIVVRLVVEIIWWIAAGDPNANGLFTSPVKTILTTLMVAYAIGRMAEYNWRRRPPAPPMPWVVRVLMR